MTRSRTGNPAAQKPTNDRVVLHNLMLTSRTSAVSGLNVLEESKPLQKTGQAKRVNEEGRRNLVMQLCVTQPQLAEFFED
jgi:hypothetical protein